MNKRQAKKKRERLLLDLFPIIKRAMKPHRPTERRQLGTFKITRQRALRMAFLQAMFEMNVLTHEEIANDPFYVKEGDLQ